MRWRFLKITLNPWMKTSETFITSYKDALNPILSPAGSADIKMILKTITDKQLTSLKDMARKLEPAPHTAKVSQEK